MKYEEVQELKERVLKKAGEFGFGLDAVAKRVRISVGVGYPDDPDKRDTFKVAVRIRSWSPINLAFRLKLKLIFGAEADVRLTGPVRPLNCPGVTPRQTRFGIGASVSNPKDRNAGTLGFFARRIRDGALGIVSNNHVIAREDLGREGEVILHPSHCDGGRAQDPSHVIARLDESYPKLHVRPQEPKVVDCAFAVLDPRVVAAIDDEILSSLGNGRRLSSTPGSLERARTVFKVGRTSNSTTGRLVAGEFKPVEIDDYARGSVDFIDPIEIESTTRAAFSDEGDSGALVCDQDNRPLGLLFARAGAGGSNGGGLHYMAPIQEVLSGLGVRIAVTKEP
ncbi:MAG TPA: hypothetical protein VFP80_04200 [Thermoanaerobaculia bacterium]|nr:hypothetical protein [Thermoanaerobaculia bacterium]